MALLYTEESSDHKLRCCRKLTSPVVLLSILLAVSICGLVVKLHHVSVLERFFSPIPVQRPDTVALQKLPPLLENFNRKDTKRYGLPSNADLTCSYGIPPLPPPPPRPQRMKKEPLRWQPAVSSKSTSKAYVFSAFYDRRRHPAVVTIIGLASEYTVVQDGDRQRFCRMWFSGEEDKPRTVAAEFRFVPETHGRQFAAVLYSCPTPSPPPYAVSLISTCTETARNLLKVVDNENEESTDDDHVTTGGKRRRAYSRHHTVCMALLHSNYSHFRQLVETVEFNRMFGAQRIVLYHLSSSPEVRLVLESYERDGIVEMIPWNSLPLSSWDEGKQASHGNKSMDVHYFAQVAAINDCLYRNLFRSTFVLFSDVDEVAVPRDASLGDNWMNVLERATRDWSAEFASGEDRFPGIYMIRNVFFISDTQSQQLGTQNYSISEWLGVGNNYTDVIDHNFREDYIYPYDIRSKYFVWTKAVVMVGIHFPYEVLNGSVKTVYVNERLCLLHHFRTKSTTQGSPNVIGDDWMARYSRNISKRIHDRRNAILNHLTLSRHLS